MAKRSRIPLLKFVAVSQEPHADRRIDGHAFPSRLPRMVERGVLSNRRDCSRSCSRQLNAAAQSIEKHGLLTPPDTPEHLAERDDPALIEDDQDLDPLLRGDEEEPTVHSEKSYAPATIRYEPHELINEGLKPKRRLQTPAWENLPIIKFIEAFPTADVVLPAYEARPKHIAEQVLPANESLLKQPCLQCELLGLPCNKAHPTCSRCERRQRHAASLHSDAGNSSLEPGNGAGPCLAKRGVTVEEIGARVFPGSLSVFARLGTDSDLLWEQKKQLREELLEREESRLDRGNWALPAVVTPREVNSREMWKRICDGTFEAGLRLII